MIGLTLDLMMVLALVGVAVMLVLSRAVSYVAPYGLAVYLTCAGAEKFMSTYGISLENEMLYIAVYGALIAVTVFVMRQIHKAIDNKIRLVKDVSLAVRD